MDTAVSNLTIILTNVYPVFTLGQAERTGSRVNVSTMSCDQSANILDMISALINGHHELETVNIISVSAALSTNHLLLNKTHSEHLFNFMGTNLKG